MTGGKKWVSVITEEHYEWLNKVIEKTDVTGGDVIRKMFDTVMEEGDSFITSLASEKVKIKEQAINDKIAALEEERRQIRKQFKGEKAVA